MGRDRFENSVRDMIDAIKLCLENGHYIPGVILIYCGVDMIAWLSQPKGQNDVYRKDFEAWVEKYLLPGSEITCSASDLYGARCGTVHSYTSESRASRERRSKEIFYEFYVGEQPSGSKKFRRDKEDQCIVINIPKLYEALIISIQRFNKHLEDDPQMADMVYKRADKFFGICKAYSDFPEGFKAK